MNQERLLKLAYFLEQKVPSEQFDLRRWGRANFSECGTSACAMGWATLCFPDSGLSLETFYIKFEGQNFPLNHDLVYREGKETYHNYEATEKFMGLSFNEACLLFNITMYSEKKPTPQVVATRIRDLVKRNQLKEVKTEELVAV